MLLELPQTDVAVEVELSEGKWYVFADLLETVRMPLHVGVNTRNQDILGPFEFLLRDGLFQHVQLPQCHVHHLSRFLMRPRRSDPEQAEVFIVPQMVAGTLDARLTVEQVFSATGMHALARAT